MIKLLVRGIPVAHPYTLTRKTEAVSRTTYDGWVQLIRRSAVHQLGPHHIPLDGLVVLSARIHASGWETLPICGLGKAIVEALTGIGYYSPTQVSKLLIDKRPPMTRAERQGSAIAEGAFIMVWPAAEVEEAFLEAVAELQRGQDGAGGSAP